MLNPSPDTNVRSSAYYVLHAIIDCRACGQSTPVAALGVPPGHETRGEPDEGGLTADALTDPWDRAEACAILFMIRAISASVVHQLQRRAPGFRMSDSTPGSESHWTNHCWHCGHAFADDALHCEPDVAFAPSSADRAQGIVLEMVREPLT